MNKNIDQKVGIKDPRGIRQKLGINQEKFWSVLGVTQSGGSRYENGRSMPKPVSTLLNLIHVQQIDVRKLKKEHVRLIEYLHHSEPELLKELSKKSRSFRPPQSNNDSPVAS